MVIEAGQLPEITVNTHLDSLMLTADQFARLMQMSTKQLLMLHGRGQVLRKAQLSGDTRCFLWPLPEIIHWLECGAPAQDEWESIRDYKYKGHTRGR